MAVERRLSIPGVLNRIPEACDFVVQAAEAAGLDERAVYYCQMAVDEWCTNIVEHGYGEEHEGHLIDIYCVGKRNYLAITVSDDSPAFNPTTLAPTEPSKMLDQREPGGLGWFFIRKIMDEVHYEYRDGRNNLTMIKRSNAVDSSRSKLVEPVYQSEALPGDIWVILPTGRLDSSTSRILEATFTAQLEDRHVRLIVDMSGVNYISSSGLKAILAAWQKARKFDGDLVLAGMSLRVRKVFEMVGFDMLFTIVDTVGDAAAHLDSISGTSQSN
jgi:anti-anti-sigma factor